MNIAKRVRELKKQGKTFEFLEGWLSGYGEASDELAKKFDKDLTRLQKDLKRLMK